MGQDGGSEEEPIVMSVERIVPDADDESKYLFPFASVHVDSAAIFARKAKRFEKYYEEERLDELVTEDRHPPGNRHRSFVVHSIISSVSFLETISNEIYMTKLDRNDSQEQKDGAIDTENAQGNNLVELISKLDYIHDRPFVENPFIKKYQLLLVYANAEPFNHGKQPLQDIETIRRLRNHMIHHVPEWVERGHEDGDHIEHPIGSSLQGKFKINPLVQDDAPFFPHKCLSYGCAEWCLKSVLDFADEFCDRMAISPPYGRGPYIDPDEWDV